MMRDCSGYFINHMSAYSELLNKSHQSQGIAALYESVCAHDLGQKCTEPCQRCSNCCCGATSGSRYTISTVQNGLCTVIYGLVFDPAPLYSSPYTIVYVK